MKKNVRIFPLIFSILFIVSCSDEEIPKQPKAEPIVLKATFDKKIEQDNDFAFDLFKTTYQSEKETNLFISPLSVSLALNMTMNGAKGNTLNEMLTALRISGYSMDEINEYSKTLREALLKVDPSTQISIANSIWSREGFKVEQPFIDVNKNYYNAEAHSVNFSDNKIVTRINNWCASNTNNKIPTILESIPGDVVMYLINATYFKGIWAYKFDKKDTSESVFYAENGEAQTVKMMNQKASYKYAVDDISSYIELPYGNEAFSMVLVLPNEGKTIKQAVENMNSQSWKSVLERMSLKKFQLFLPRFKFEAEYGLRDNILPLMGMKEAFYYNKADLSGINTERKLYISEVKHKTYVEVNEEGTEAAAVTSVEIGELSSSGENLFRVDKPFLFVIKEQSTGIILFIGKVGKVEQ